MPGSHGRMLGNDRANIRLRLRVGRRANVRLIRPVIGQTLDQFPGRRPIDGWEKECRLAGIQDDLLGPFARGCNPDGTRAGAVRPIGKPVRQLRQRPAGYQQKNGEYPTTARYLAMGKADGSGGLGNFDRPMTAMLGRSHRRAAKPQCCRGTATSTRGNSPSPSPRRLHHGRAGRHARNRAPSRLRDLHEWRHDELHRVDVHVKKRRSRLRQPVLDRGLQFVRIRSSLPQRPSARATPAKFGIVTS